MGWGAAAGALGGAAVSAFGAHKANKKNIGLAKDQMAFQERMSNTAHQREVKDLKAAGLNPVLSAMGGQGAASPSGQTAQMKNVAEGASSSAMQFMQGLKQLEKTDADIANVKADTANKTPEALLKGQASNAITDVINRFTTDSPSAKQTSKAKGDAMKEVYKKSIEPRINSAKKGYKSLKRDVMNYGTKLKNKWNKMFN